MKGAWVTLATNDSYSLGALVLAHSLKQVGTTQELALLVTPGVTSSMRSKLSQVFNVVVDVNVLDSKDQANLKLLQRPELGVTFTKLHCWRLTQYDKCVFLDADTLVLRNCDELFEREELSAAPDVGWPDCFNSGVFVYRPSNETYDKLIQFALDKGSFDGGDQGLLNLYFSDWAYKDISKHLPFIYNVCSTAFYSYLPAFKQFGKDAKIIHFIGNSKPWLQYFDSETRRVRPSGDISHLGVILQKWWDIFCTLIHPNLSSDMSGLAGAFSKLTLGQRRSSEQEALEDSLRRQNWEQGNIDYLGKDSFDNIWSKICETLAKGPQTEPEAVQVPAVIQPEIPEAKLTPEKTSTAAGPQEEKPVQLETAQAVEPQQLSTEPTVENIEAPSQVKPSEPIVSSVSETTEKAATIQTPTPAVSAVDETVQQVCPIIPKEIVAAVSCPIIPKEIVAAVPESVPAVASAIDEKLDVVPAVEAPIVEGAQTQPPPSTAEAPSELVPSLPEKSAAPVEKTVDTNKVTSVVMQEPLIPEIVDAAAPVPVQQQQIPPSPPLTPSSPIVPTAPAAELVETPLICPLVKPTGDQKSVSAPVAEITTEKKEVTDTPAPPIPESSTTKPETRATSVQIPTDLPTETQPNITPAPPAQVETPVPQIQTQPEVLKEQTITPPPQTPVEAASVASQTSSHAIILEPSSSPQPPTPVSVDTSVAETPVPATPSKTPSPDKTPPKDETPVVETPAQAPAPASQSVIESSQKEPTETVVDEIKPESTCPQPPIAPPPRKTGANKKQGKSKK